MHNAYTMYLIPPLPFSPKIKQKTHSVAHSAQLFLASYPGCLLEKRNEKHNLHFVINRREDSLCLLILLALFPDTNRQCMHFLSVWFPWHYSITHNQCENQ